MDEIAKTGRLIYICEDEPSIRRLETTALLRQGYRVKDFPNGTELLDEFNKKKPDLLILDLMLPDIQGEDILKTIRANSENDDVAIIIVSAKNMVADRVDNLDMGADDYIEKPFDILEFLARVNARLRVNESNKDVVVGDLKIITKAQKVFYKGNEIKFTNAEFTILHELALNNGSTINRKRLVELLWGGADSLTTRTIDIHVTNIRRKLGDSNGEFIQTVYGVGYRMKKPDKED